MSSSLLPIEARHLQAAPQARYVREERVPVRCLDDVTRESLKPSSRVLLKLDVQGYEDRVLAGAEKILDQVVLIEAELSLCRLYDGQLLCVDMLGMLAELGFELACSEDAFVDPVSGRTLQIDGIFARSQTSASKGRE
ncbi:MAG: FkbM family methyltransferase [Actinobacteria bacterium]|nr:FkbM family methyltransferase [Actinomycetota bacterium]